MLRSWLILAALVIGTAEIHAQIGSLSYADHSGTSVNLLTSSMPVGRTGDLVGTVDTSLQAHATLAVVWAFHKNGSIYDFGGPDYFGASGYLPLLVQNPGFRSVRCRSRMEELPPRR